MQSDLVSYYRDRAKEYEDIYAKPERQADLAHAARILEEIFRNRQLLEIACGTGYWTERIARTAKMIVATDINDAVLDIARAKTYAPAQVMFSKADLYQPRDQKFNESLFGGFIWSHIPLPELEHFITIIGKQLVKGAPVVFMDNMYVAGSNHPIVETDESGNTYQLRMLQDGSQHKILKNFPTQQFIQASLGNQATDIHFTSLQYFWILQYQTA